jgi:hypothetical protein
MDTTKRLNSANLAINLKNTIEATCHFTNDCYNNEIFLIYMIAS